MNLEFYSFLLKEIAAFSSDEYHPSDDLKNSQGQDV